ncbi:DMT family transporter [Saccharibacillus kuerlensis]|uniref:Membrane protein n=1 Tax=Saccharibacillus kuerlensis TaxID=459527 RepID=A0ABQ2KVH8_9BACL|nr:DMT family transporter [Saccharibacillus kuerlensis]GGN94602.1 membrane protein [Saccharibacillus kuerlensis]
MGAIVKKREEASGNAAGVYTDREVPKGRQSRTKTVLPSEFRTARTLYLVAALIAITLWSTSFVGTKIAYASFPPLTLGAARFAIASLILGAIVLLRREFTVPAPKDLGMMAVSGLLGTTLYFALENIGLELTTASSAALIVASYPAVTALLEFFFYRTRISWMRVIGIAMAVFGVYRISGGSGGEGGAHELTGNLLLIAAGFVFAIYNFATRKVVGRYSMVTVSFYQTIAGTFAFIPLALTETKQWQTPTAESLWMLLYLGVFCSVAAFMLYNFGLRGLTAGTAMGLMNLVPVIGVALSIGLLGEKLHPGDWIGGIIVIVGVILSVREQPRRIHKTAGEIDLSS